MGNEKYCVDCKHMESRGIIFKMHWCHCRKMEITNPVTGQIFKKVVPCHVARNNFHDLCRWDGEWFENK